ncbi:MAG: 4-(cytidine 5'-diphospho)-2-C-methyl-D-erythritol kinase [Gemmataceae bacterium]|nr:4-(cytidine 5'-diphospho)-2-C-methyl-D-erythritol kinase [Gemmataceae bacterium]
MSATSPPPRTATAHTMTPAGPSGLVVAAPAKLNLFLEVRGKRPDGYHDLESLMVGVDLYDTLEVQPAAGGRITLACDPPGLSTGPDNLVWRAADRLRTAAGRPDLGAAIRLTKRIPAQAGLAGGSSDAAAALVGLDRVWGLDRPKAELAAVAAEIGSDVAFFLDLPAARCTGRGEVVSPERPGAGFHFVLVCPPVGLGTADVFRQLRVPDTPVSGDAARAAFRAGDPEALGAALFNRLEEPAFGLAPLVKAVYQRLAGLNPAGCRMSGSGSAVFAVARDAADAARVAAAFRAATPPAEPESRVLLVRSRHLVPG